MQLQGLSAGGTKNSRTKHFTGLGERLFKADFERRSVNTAQMNGAGTMAL